MYSKPDWEKGYYLANLGKYECMCCHKEFILGMELVPREKDGYPCCPYCGSDWIELTAWTDDSRLEDLVSDLGCLAIGLSSDCFGKG